MTSGPWELVITDYVLLIVANKQRDLVFELGMPLRDEAGIASEATIANALLIAAAPCLLSAIESIFAPGYWEGFDFDAIPDDSTVDVKLTKAEWLALRDACRKARGDDGN